MAWPEYDLEIQEIEPDSVHTGHTNWCVEVRQHGKAYRARNWRLTDDVIGVIEVALNHRLAAMWQRGHPQPTYMRSLDTSTEDVGKKFYMGSHHLSFARFREKWVFVLGAGCLPADDLRFVTFRGAFYYSPKGISGHSELTWAWQV